MAARDWATWHLSNQSLNATCRSLIHPHLPPCQLPRWKPYTLSSVPHHLSYTQSSLPCHLMMSSMPHVTLPVVTRVTPGLVQVRAKNAKSTCHMSRSGATTCPIRNLPCVNVQTCHMSCTD
jgi:hypothetical protein